MSSKASFMPAYGSSATTNVGTAERTRRKYHLNPNIDAIIEEADRAIGLRSKEPLLQEFEPFFHPKSSVLSFSNSAERL